MKERPILFSGAMVRAILEGRKTQTRRVIKPHPDTKAQEIVLNERYPNGNWKQFLSRVKIESNPDRFEVVQMFNCPYGQPGDRLWVRETWAKVGCIGKPTDWFEYNYRADFESGDCSGYSDMCFDKWKPSMHMPKSASRILLEIKDIRPERLLHISEEDAIAEGVYWSERFGGYVTDEVGSNFHASSPQISYLRLWESINGPESVDQNRFVWVVEFEVK